MPQPRSTRGRALVAYLEQAPAPFAELVGVAVDGPRDIVDIVVEPALAQHRHMAIRAREPVSISFDLADASAPRIASRRPDFPPGIHTNRESGDDGLYLCIWEEGWADLRRGLTPQALIERIRDWFVRAAEGTLHQDGQALEPLLPASADLIILPVGEPPDELHIAHADRHEGRWTLVLDRQPAREAPFAPFAIAQWRLGPIIHGPLGQAPQTLGQLATEVAPLGLDLAPALADWLSAEADQQGLAGRHLLILLWIAKQATADAPVEWEVRAYLAGGTLGSLGDLLGRTVLDIAGDRLARRLIAGPAGDIATVDAQGWRVVQRLDRAAARHFAGTPLMADRRLVAIGAGALGSQLVANSVRAGIGHWTVVDNDVVLPHNIVRQTQPDRAVGYAKAETLAADAGSLLAEPSVTPIRADLLAPGNAAAGIAEAIAKADLVCDLSASPAVLGALADRSDMPRAASVFFNPDGTDLVLLAEDAARALRLDELEAQYFLAMTKDGFADHLGAARLDRLRYANACQDLSRPLPPWQIQALACIANGALIRCLASEAHQAALWRLDPATGAVAAHSLLVTRVHRQHLGGFRVTISDGVLATMRGLRAMAAPDETGGILIGSYDAERRVVHIVEALAAPPDSRQSPSHFVRGAHALTPQLARIAARSAGTLGYLGEWHSHPDGAAVQPSSDDEQVYAYLRGQIDPAGAPYAMLIMGASQSWLQVGWSGQAAGWRMEHG